MTSEAGIAAADAEAVFTERMRATVTSGFVLAGLSLGVKLRLFDILAQTDTPITSSDLANSSNCKERYIREWLHHMVLCDIVEVDTSGKLFTLPVSRRNALTDRKQLVQSMGSAFPCMLEPYKEILGCFSKDGPNGLPFASVLPFFEERTQMKAQVDNVVTCADTVRDTVPGLKEKLESGIHVCDIGSGNGTLIFHLARQFPRSTFTGIDLSSDLMEMAMATKTEENITNVSLFLQDAAELPETWHDTFDYAIIRDVLHDLAHVSKALASVYKCLKPGGAMSVFEVNLSRNPHDSWRNPRQKALGEIVYAISMYHCLAGSMYESDSQGLGAGAGIETIIELVTEAGFKVDGEPRESDWANVHILFTK